MSENIGGGWRDYRPTKGALVWSFVGGAIVTLVVGFAGFDWYTAGSAQELAEERAEEARAQLASAICVERFMAGPDAGERLATLKNEDSWSQDDFIEEGGWVTLANLEEPVDGAAEICAETLVEMEAPAKSAGTANTTEG